MSIDVYRSLISNNPDAIIVLNPNGKTLDINDAGIKMFGYTYEKFMELKHEDILISNSDVDTTELFVKTLKGESCSYSASVYHQNGKTLHLQVKNVPMMDNDSLVGVMIVAKDVTDLMETRAVLHTTSERLRSLYESSADAIDVIDLDGNVLSVNHAFEELYGWKESEILGKPMPTIPEERTNDVNARRELIEMGQSIRGLEVTCLKKDGTLFDVNISVSPLFDQSGKVIAYSGISRDISDRKKWEAALEQSKERYKFLLNASPEAILVQTNGIIRYVNDSGCSMFGYKEPSELFGRDILDFIHPTSMEVALDRIKRSNKGDILQKESIEQMMLRKDGSSFPVEGTALGIDYEDEPSTLLLVRDISERRMFEEQLIRSEERYRLIADNMTDFVAILDKEGVIKYASPSSINVFGFSPDSLEGNKMIEFVHTDFESDVVKMSQDLFTTKGSKEMELRVKHKTRKWIWIETKGTYFIDEEHEESHLLIVAYSIEKRKALQDKLKKMAFHDELTDLPNRRLFHETLKQTVLDGKRHRRKHALLYMDIDKFKWVNDTLGHATGDELLKLFSQRVSACLRESDILSRHGGDEFTVLLSDIEDEKSAEICAERILKALQEDWIIEEHTFKTTSSIGIAIFPKDGVEADILMRHADQALYNAKQSGRNTYRLYTEKEF